MAIEAKAIAELNRHIAAGALTRAEAIGRAALANDPDDAAVLLILGVLADRRGQGPEAALLFERATRCAPDMPEAHHNLAAMLARQGRIDAAIAAYDRAVALAPARADFWMSRGAALHGAGRREAAAQSFERAAALRPGFVEAHNNLGVVLRELGKSAAALAQFRRAEALAPTNADVQLNLGLIEQDQGRIEEAVRRYERALALKPGLSLALGNLALAYQDLGRTEDALALHQRALAATPPVARSHIGRVVATLPVLYRDEGEVARARASYGAALRDLAHAADSAALRRALAPAVGSSQPFYLAYQGENDRALQETYGALMCRLMAERFPAAALPPPPAPGERIRVGIVSAFLSRHSNWSMPIRGWVEGLDPVRFDLFLYHTRGKEDAETRRAAGLAGHFVQGPLSLERWRDLILADRPHVLIYPEIGMDGMAAQLAALRLAPVQCNSWGHPQTSGYPTLDYFLSSALMEPPDAQAHYTERLIRLPGLGVKIAPLDVVPRRPSRTARALDAADPVFWCGQSLYKYLPRFDEVFPRIARGLGRCRFLFVAFARGTHVTRLFQDRMARAFAAFGLDAASHCELLPQLDIAGFLGVMGECDVFLDSIGWSGCNSTVESLVHDLPIVTYRGSLMRGRHSAAILDQMGMGDTVAETIDDYVALAVRLGCDRDFRAATRARVAAGKARVFGDDLPIRALEAFLEAAVARDGA